jgi:hypothetical protein
MIPAGILIIKAIVIADNVSQIDAGSLFLMSDIADFSEDQEIPKSPCKTLLAHERYCMKIG